MENKDNNFPQLSQAVTDTESKNIFIDAANKDLEKALSANDTFLKTFAEMNTRYANAQQMQAFQQQQLLNSYFPINPAEHALRNAVFETALPVIAGGLTGKYMMSRTGSLLKSIPYAAGAAALTGATAISVLEPGLGDMEDTMQRLQSSGPMNAYWARSNWISSGGNIYNPGYFRSSFEYPAAEAARVLGVNPSQVGAGISDVVNMGLVEGTSPTRNAASVVKDATVLFKSLEAFFGSVDIQGLTQKMGAMLASGFTPETMSRAASVMNQSIFATATPETREAIIQGATQYGGQFASMGLAPNLGADIYINSAQAAYRGFGRLDDYNKFLFRTPGNLAGTAAGAYSRFMQNNGLATILGGGDQLTGSIEMASRFDLTSVSGIRDFNRFQYEATVNTSSSTVRNAMLTQARTMAATLGIDVEAALTQMTGSTQAAKAILLEVDTANQMREQNLDFFSKFGRSASVSGNAAGILRTLTAAAGGSGSMLGMEEEWAARLARMEAFGGGLSEGLYSQSRLGQLTYGALDIFRTGAAAATGIGRITAFGRETEASLSGRLAAADSRNDILQRVGGQGGTAAFVAGITRGVTEVAEAGGRYSGRTGDYIRQILSNPTLLENLRRARASGFEGGFDRQTIAGIFESAGLTELAGKVMSDPTELGRIYEGIKASGNTEFAALLSDTIFSGFDPSRSTTASMVGQNIIQAGINPQLMTAKALGSIMTTVGGTAAFIGNFAGPLSPFVKGAGIAAAALGVGFTYVAPAIFGDGVTKEEAAAFNNNLYQDKILVDTLVATFTIFKSQGGIGNLNVWGRLSQFWGTDAGNVINNAAETITTALYQVMSKAYGGNGADIKARREANKKVTESQLMGELLSILTVGSSASSNSADKVMDWVSYFSDKGNSGKLLGVIRLFMKHFSTAPSVISPESLVAQVMEKVKQEITGKAGDEGEFEVYKKLLDSMGGEAGSRTITALGNRLDISADQARQSNALLNEFNRRMTSDYNISNTNPLFQTLVALSKDKVSEPEAVRKVSDVIAKTNPNIRPEDLSKTAKQVFTNFGSMLEGAQTAVQSTDALKDRVRNVITDLAEDKVFVKSIQTILRPAILDAR